MDKTDKMIMDLTLKLNDDERKYLLYIVHLVHKYEEIFDKLKTYVNIYETIRGYHEKYDKIKEDSLYNDDLKENILELLEEIE